jgi:hypothetical protein
MLVPHYRSLFKFHSYLGLIYLISFASISRPGVSKQKDREKVREAEDFGVEG